MTRLGNDFVIQWLSALHWLTGRSEKWLLMLQTDRNHRFNSKVYPANTQWSDFSGPTN